MIQTQHPPRVARKHRLTMHSTRASCLETAQTDGRIAEAALLDEIHEHIRQLATLTGQLLLATCHGGVAPQRSSLQCEEARV